MSGGVSLLLLASAYWMLVSPGASYTRIWLNDVFGFTSAAYRVFLGQIPSVDFFSGAGAGLYYPAALGFALGLDPSVVVAFGQIVVAALLLPAAALVCAPRFSLQVTVALLLFLALLIVAPMGLGGSPFDTSFGVFYNRHGWAALTILLLYFTEPAEIRRDVLIRDSVIFALLLLFLFYTTINFAAIALAYAVANGVVSAYARKVGFVSLVVLAILLGLVEWSSGYNSAYLGDILDLMGKKSQALGGLANLREMAGVVSREWLSLVVATTSLVVLWTAGPRRYVDAAFLAGAVAVSAILATQTESGTAGMPALLAVVVCLGERVRRGQVAAGRRSLAGVGYLWALGLTVVFISKPLITGSVAVAHSYSRSTSADFAHADQLFGTLQGFRVPDKYRADMHDVLGHEPDAHRLLAQLRRTTRDELQPMAFVEVVDEGARLLQGGADTGSPVIVFDDVNPFTALLRLEPTSYGFPVFYEGSAFNRRHFPEPEQFFSDAAYVMLPTVPYTQVQLDTMLDVYGDYLSQNFEPVEESAHWTLLARKVRYQTD